MYVFSHLWLHIGPSLPGKLGLYMYTVGAAAQHERCCPAGMHSVQYDTHMDIHVQAIGRPGGGR